MPSIFISYRRDPQAAWAGRLHDRLSAHFGVGSVFLDVDMEPGIDFVQALEERVSRCGVLIALIGKDWRHERLARPEDWVRLEIEAALKRGIRVIPVLVDGVRMPAADELPESLRPLVRRHALDVGHASFHRDTEVLIRTIEGLQVATAPWEAVAPSMPRRFDKRLVIGLAAALVVPAGSYYAWRRPVELERRQTAIEPRTRQMRDSLTYVWIPPGKFQMGCSPGDAECLGNEKPPHEVEVTRGFWLTETEVTQPAWRKIMGTDPSVFKGDQLPVDSVTWAQARDYCAKVGGRLPTEAEWEYAARAGNPSSRYGDLSAIAWYGVAAKGTNPVGDKKPNAWGLYDMLGNVWEWTADWYDGEYYQSKEAVDPAGPESGTHKVVRGGSWFLFPRSVRASNRSRSGVSFRYDDIGFRCAGEFR